MSHSHGLRARLRGPALLTILVAMTAAPADAQDRREAPAERPQGPSARHPQGRYLPVDTAITTTHAVTILGKRVPYRATVGTQPVWDEEGKPVASLFYTYYQRSDVADPTTRPLMISFNGGPGSASVWMHIGYTGPKLLRIDDEGFPVFPYGVVDNPHSLLDVADIVFVDPVNTGFSRIVGNADRKQFFGVNQDLKYLAAWIDAFVSRQGRWNSPKFLIGESYGTTRVAGLAGTLQNNHWMFLNGVVLVSPTGMGIERDGPVGDAINLPYMAAAAWYHKALPADLQTRDLEQMLPEVERFTIDEYIPALTRGSSLDPARRREVAARVARYTGLSEAEVLDHNLVIPTSYFWKGVLRDRQQTVGRLDSRYLGIDRQNAGTRYDYAPELTSWEHSFTPAVNYFLRDVLGFETDLQYWIFGPVHPWDRSGDNTAEQLRLAMAQNPWLHVLVQAGYYDGGTPYFPSKYTMWQMDPAGRLSDRIDWKGYRSGHMMYLRREDLAASTDHLREFIARAMATASRPAKY